MLTYNVTTFLRKEKKKSAPAKISANFFFTVLAAAVCIGAYSWIPFTSYFVESIPSF